MIQIRNGVFETNSSSVHSICISKSHEFEKQPEIYFGFGEYGWEESALDSVEERAAYLWTGIVNYFDDDISSVEETKNQIIEMLNSEGIICEFAKYRIEKSSFSDSQYCDIDGYVDHSSELGEFINAVISDKDRLLRYLLSPNSVVYTGNDNTDIIPETFGIADTYAWDYDNHYRYLNPYHDEEHYEYFEKGN